MCRQRGQTGRRGAKLRPSLLDAVFEHVAAFVECLQRIDTVVERASPVQRDNVVNFEILLQKLAAHGAAPLLLCSHARGLEWCDAFPPCGNAALPCGPGATEFSTGFAEETRSA